MGGSPWTADRVIDALAAAFVANPGLAIYSPPEDLETTDRPTGRALVAVTARLLTPRSQACVWLLERARAKTNGGIKDLIRTKGWAESTFYEVTKAAAAQVATYLNEGACEPEN